MTEPELRGFAQSIRQGVEIEPGYRLELSPRRSTRPHEVRVIRVRESVRPSADLRDYGALLEREHRLGGAHEGEQGLDRLPALRVYGRVGRALDGRELDALGMRKPDEECRRLLRGCPELDVRRAPERDRARAEECAAEVCGATAAPRDDTPRRPLERCVASIYDPRRREDAERVGVSGDVQLVSGRRVERAATVGPDLGPDAALAEKRECTPRSRPAPEVEVERPVAGSAQVQAASRVEEGRELGATVALALRRDRRELLADVLRRDQSTTPSSASRRRLTSTPADP